MNLKSLSLLIAVLPCMTLVRAATNEPSRLAPVVVEATPVSGQQTPSSVTTLAGPALADTGAKNVYDLGAFAPNFSLTPSTSRSFGDIYAVRGIGNTQFFSSPAVAMYVDDVPISGVIGYPVDLLQTERVELWRGSQSAMFGQNSEAGVLNIVSRRATNQTEAFAETSYGTYNEQIDRIGAMGALIKDKLFYTIAGEFSHLDGFLNNPTLHTHPDKQEGWNGRFTLTWTPTADWDVSFTLAAEKNHDGARIVPLGSNSFRSPSATDPIADADNNTEALRIARTFNNFTVTSISAHRGYNLEPAFLDFRDPVYVASGGTPSTVQMVRDTETWSEELRLQTLDTGNWQCRGGFFFATSRQNANDLRTYYIPFPFPQTTQYNITDDNYALFGQATYTGFDKFAITFGTRFDYTVAGIQRTKTSTTSEQASKGMFNTAPKLTISYQLTTNLLAYVSTGLAFKPGGYSGYIDPPASPAFGTERNWASEIGLKSTWLDGKFLANVTLFYNHINNYQVELMDALGNLTVYNADLVTSYGTEVELIARPVAGLQLSTAVGYTVAQFDHFTDPTTNINCDGKRPPYVPDLTANVAIQYRHPTGFFGRLELQATGHTSYDDANSAAYSASSYGIFNARIGYEAKQWGIYLYGRNLTDTDYFARIITAPASAVPGEPRMLGVMATIRY